MWEGARVVVQGSRTRDKGRWEGEGRVMGFKGEKEGKEKEMERWR